MKQNLKKLAHLGPWSARIALAAMLLVLAASAVEAQDLGRCAKVELDDPVLLPDETLLQAGTLRLCLERRISPVTALHVIRANGFDAALVMSRIGKSEGQAERDPVIVFERMHSGKLRLVGYAWPNGDRMKTYLLHEFAERRQAFQTALQSDREPRDDDDYVLIAARTD